MRLKSFVIFIACVTGASALAAPDRKLEAQAIVNRAYVLTLPAKTDTLVGRSTTDTLTGKTIDGSKNTLSNLPSQKDVAEALTNKTIDGTKNTLTNLPSQKDVTEELTGKTIDAQKNTLLNLPASGGGSVNGASVPRARIFIYNSGNWTVPANVTRIQVRLVGGGGGGGGGSASSGAAGGAGGGGGSAGSYLVGALAVTPGTVYAIAIGAGGAGSANGVGGVQGNTTTWSQNTTQLYGASGGLGGFTPGSGAVPGSGGVNTGTATGGDFNVTGGPGEQGHAYGNGNNGPGGRGSDSPFCAGGRGGASSTAPGINNGAGGAANGYDPTGQNAKPGYGGCGGGGGSGGAYGGAGAAGLVEITY